MAIFGSSNQSPSSEQVKATIVRSIQQEAAVSNARVLINKVNENCFDSCVPSPGSALTSAEESCISNCMEKYISLWNTASKTYISRVAQESKKLGATNQLQFAQGQDGSGGNSVVG